MTAAMEPLEAEDVADAIRSVVTRPRRVAVNEACCVPPSRRAEAG
jgi:NADP-dependent 3-hydroxy acid dehydrogenase YdfG